MSAVHGVEEPGCQAVYNCTYWLSACFRSSMKQNRSIVDITLYMQDEHKSVVVEHQ